MDNRVALAATRFLPGDCACVQIVAEEYGIAVIGSENHDVAACIRLDVADECGTLANLLLRLPRPGKQNVPFFQSNRGGGDFGRNPRVEATNHIVVVGTAGEGLGDAVQFALHGGGNGGQPFVVHDEGLDFVLGEGGVFGVELGFQVVLRGLEPGLGVRLLVQQVGVVFEGLAFLGVIRVAADFLEAGLYGFGGDADGLGHDAADFGRGVELALALAALGGEVPHEILVGIAEDVVVLGAVLGEIERGVLEDED